METEALGTEKMAPEAMGNGIPSLSKSCWTPPRAIPGKETEAEEAGVETQAETETPTQT